MKAFLLALKAFAESICGLIVVSIIVLWHWDILGIIENFPPFNLLTIGSFLGMVLLMFAIVWSQIKSKALLSHGILFFLFASSLTGFIGALFSNTPSSAFSGETLVNVLIMFYTLGVVAAYILYDKPKPAKLIGLTTLPMLIFFGAYYLLAGFSGLLLALLIILVALLLGSKVVALTYPMYLLIGAIFSRMYLIFEAFSNNLDQQINIWFMFVILTASFVLLTMELLKAVQSNET